MREWAVWNKEHSLVLRTFPAREGAEAKQWFAERGKLREDPESILFGALLEERVWETALEAQERQVRELASLVQQLASELGMRDPSNPLRGKAADYLADNKLVIEAPGRIAVLARSA